MWPYQAEGSKPKRLAETRSNKEVTQTWHRGMAPKQPPTTTRSWLGSSQTWLPQTWLFAIFTRRRSFALICVLAFALFWRSLALICIWLLLVADRKGTTKKLCDKDFAERSGEFSGAICLKTLVLLGNDLVTPSNCSENSLALFVRFFGFVSPFWLLI